MIGVLLACACSRCGNQQPPWARRNLNVRAAGPCSSRLPGTTRSPPSVLYYFRYWRCHRDANDAARRRAAALRIQYARLIPRGPNLRSRGNHLGLMELMLPSPCMESNAMKKFALLALVGAALFATSGAASAQYYGPGVGVYIGPPERGYDEPRYYRRDRERYSDYDRRYDRQARSCRRGYTVQDGVCKPYRGY